MKTAYLYNDGDYTFFKVGREVVKFRTSPYLENYTEIKEYDDGYMVLMAQLSTLAAPDEDYMDIKGVFEELELDTSILSQVSEVIIKCKVPIMNKHTGLVHLRAFRDDDILKLVPISRVYDGGMLYIDFKNMHGEKLIAVLLTDVVGVKETERGPMPTFAWSVAAFPAAYRKALGLFKDMRDEFYVYQVEMGSKAPDAMFYDADNDVMLPVHLFSVQEYNRKHEDIEYTYLFYNTRTTNLCLGVYDADTESHKLENSDCISSYWLKFGIYRLIGVVLTDDRGVQ